MKTNKKLPAPTFGELVFAAYESYGMRRAMATIQLASEARLIALKGKGHIVLYQPEPGRQDGLRS